MIGTQWKTHRKDYTRQLSSMYVLHIQVGAEKSHVCYLEWEVKSCGDTKSKQNYCMLTILASLPSTNSTCLQLLMNTLFIYSTWAGPS